MVNLCWYRIQGEIDMASPVIFPITYLCNCVMERQLWMFTSLKIHSFNKYLLSTRGTTWIQPGAQVTEMPGPAERTFLQWTQLTLTQIQASLYIEVRTPDQTFLPISYRAWMGAPEITCVFLEPIFSTSIYGWFIFHFGYQHEKLNYFSVYTEIHSSVCVCHLVFIRFNFGFEEKLRTFYHNNGKINLSNGISPGPFDNYLSGILPREIFFWMFQLIKLADLLKRIYDLFFFWKSPSAIHDLGKNTVLSPFSP